MKAPALTKFRPLSCYYNSAKVEFLRKLRKISKLEVGTFCPNCSKVFDSCFFFQEVLAKQNAIQNDIQKMRQRQGMLKVVKMTVSNARIGKTTKGLPLNPKPAKQLLAKSLDAATLDRSIQSNARKFGKRASIE